MPVLVMAQSAKVEFCALKSCTSAATVWHRDSQTLGKTVLVLVKAHSVMDMSCASR